MQIRLIRGRITLATRTIAGQPVTVDGTTVIPEGRALLIQTPVTAFIRMRPTAVLVQRQGQSDRLPIRNATLLLQAGAIVLGFLITTGIQRYVIHTKEQRP